MTIKELPPPKFKSESAVIELIRGMFDVAFTHRIIYLEINYKLKGSSEIKSHSIVTKDSLGID